MRGRFIDSPLTARLSSPKSTGSMLAVLTGGRRSGCDLFWVGRNDGCTGCVWMRHLPKGNSVTWARARFTGGWTDLGGVATSGQMGTDGLWARLRGKAKRVVLLLSDSVTGVVWPLMTHPLGKKLAQNLRKPLNASVVHLLKYNQGLVRVSPEWYWRDLRLRLSHGRNHGSEQRLQWAALLWAIDSHFTPAQWRSERKRRYPRSGLSPLEAAGAKTRRCMLSGCPSHLTTRKTEAIVQRMLLGGEKGPSTNHP